MVRVRPDHNQYRATCFENVLVRPARYVLPLETRFGCTRRAVRPNRVCRHSRRAPGLVSFFYFVSRINRIVAAAAADTSEHGENEKETCPRQRSLHALATIRYVNVDRFNADRFQYIIIAFYAFLSVQFFRITSLAARR